MQRWCNVTRTLPVALSNWRFSAAMPKHFGIQNSEWSSRKAWSKGSCPTWATQPRLRSSRSVIGIRFSEEVPESPQSFFWFCVICQKKNWQISKKRNENLGLKFPASDKETWQKIKPSESVLFFACVNVLFGSFKEISRRNSHLRVTPNCLTAFCGT